jgi:hypothetical protein
MQSRKRMFVDLDALNAILCNKGATEVWAIRDAVGLFLSPEECALLTQTEHLGPLSDSVIQHSNSR